MSVTRIRYDERSFTSLDECLSEISRRLQQGWYLSAISRSEGRVRAVFGWQTAADDVDAPRSSAAGGAR